MTRMIALLYSFLLLIINALFVEQAFRQCKSTSLPKILATILLCGGDFRSRAKQGKRSSYTNVHFGTSMLNECVQILFCIFLFVIPKVCLTVRVFHFLNLESLKRIYASLFTFRDFRHRCTMILKTLKHVKTAERNSTTNECIFHKLAVKNVNVNVVKTIYCQRNSIFLAKKNYSIHYLTGQNRGLSGLKNI